MVSSDTPAVSKFRLQRVGGAIERSESSSTLTLIRTVRPCAVYFLSVGFDGCCMTGAPGVFLVASSGDDAVENFRRTVLDGVPMRTVNEHTSVPFNSEEVSIWGTKGGNHGAWKKVREGDYLLFYQDQRFPYAARVLGTEENESLGRSLWPDHETGDPWKYIIFLFDVTETVISRMEINRHAGYADNFAPQGFQSLRPSGVESIREQYGSLYAFLNDTIEREREEKESAFDIYSRPKVDVPKSILDGLYFPDGVLSLIHI